MEPFAVVVGALVSVVTFFGFGWVAHTFFHRREHDRLSERISELEQELQEAQEDQQIVVNFQSAAQPAERAEPADELTLSEDERAYLLQVVHDGDAGPVEGMAWHRWDLARQRVSEKGLIEDDQDGTHHTRAALEWMERQGLL